MKESRQQNISASFATNGIAVLAVLSFIYCCKVVLMFYNGSRHKNVFNVLCVLL